MLQFEVAGTVIQLEDNEAALVVYCHPSLKGKVIRLDTTFRYPVTYYEHFHQSAQVIERGVDNSIVYAAVFPRIHFLREGGYEAGYRDCEVKVSMETTFFDKSKGQFLSKTDYPSIFAGNVTEVDWTTYEAQYEWK